MKVWVVVPSGSVEREIHNIHIVSYSNSCDKTLSKVQNVLSFAMEDGVYPPIITDIWIFRHQWVSSWFWIVLNTAIGTNPFNASPKPVEFADSHFTLDESTYLIFLFLTNCNDSTSSLRAPILVISPAWPYSVTLTGFFLGSPLM